MIYIALWFHFLLTPQAPHWHQRLPTQLRVDASAAKR
jgi:hypothetical protein